MEALVEVVVGGVELVVVAGPWYSDDAGGGFGPADCGSVYSLVMTKLLLLSLDGLELLSSEAAFQNEYVSTRGASGGDGRVLLTTLDFVAFCGACPEWRW